MDMLTPMDESMARVIYDLYDKEAPRGKGSLRPRMGMSHSEIAEVLGISRQAVANTEQRALRKLRHALGIGGV